MKDGFLRIACATPEIRVADCEFNAKSICELAARGAEAEASLIVFPELCLTGYTCGDLFLQQTLQKGAEDALCRVLSETADLDCVLAIGLPVVAGGKLYNAAAVLFAGRSSALFQRPSSRIIRILRASPFHPGERPLRAFPLRPKTLLSPELRFPVPASPDSPWESRSARIFGSPNRLPAGWLSPGRRSSPTFPPPARPWASRIIGAPSSPASPPGSAPRIFMLTPGRANPPRTSFFRPRPDRRKRNAASRIRALHHGTDSRGHRPFKAFPGTVRMNTFRLLDGMETIPFALPSGRLS